MHLVPHDGVVVVPYHLGALRGPRLPDLDFAAAPEDADPVLGQQVARRVRVVVDAAVEHGRGVFADGGGDERFPAGVLVNKVCHVVHEPGHGDQRSGL